MWYGTRYYSAYQRDVESMRQARMRRSSATTKLFWLIVWFVLIVIFA